MIDDPAQHPPSFPDEAEGFVQTDARGRTWALVRSGSRMLAALDVGEFTYLAALHGTAAMRPGCSAEARQHHLWQSQMFLAGARELDPCATALAELCAEGTA